MTDTNQNHNNSLPKILKLLTTDCQDGGLQFRTPLRRPLSPPSLSTTSTSQTSSTEEPPSKKSRQEQRKLCTNTLYLGSPREVRRIRADLVEARNTILSLENRVQQMHNIRKEMQLLFDNEMKGMKRQQDNDRKSISELEAQLQNIRQRELDVKQKLADVTNQYNMAKLVKDEEIEELEKSINEYKEETTLYKQEEFSENIELNRKLTELQMLLNTEKENTTSQERLIQDLERQLAEKNATERSTESKDHLLLIAKLRIKELENEKESQSEIQSLVKNQREKISKYPDLLKEVEKLREENVRLKDGIKNKLLLEEEVFDMKKRLLHFKEQEKKLSDLQVQHIQNELQLNELRTASRSICETTASDSSLPFLLRSTFERLQQQEIGLTSTKFELESKLQTATYEAKIAQTELEKSEKLVADMKKNNEQKQTLLHRVQRKLYLVTRERDSYRMQLDSYEKDLTTTIHQNQPGQYAGHSNELQALRKRAEEMEKVLQGYRELNTNLESDLQASNPGLYSDSNLAITEKLAKLNEEVSVLKLENQSLKERRDQLEIQLEDQMVGHDTLQGGQVYHYITNPLADRLAEREKYLKQQEQEVDHLKRKIKDLECGLERSKLSESINPEEIKTLKEDIKTKEGQMQRMKDIFKSSMQDFRNVIYMLLGYKIDRQKSLYKLTSVYADRAEDQLCFQINSEGSLDLLENEFSLTLDEMVNLHLKHQKSIPVFLSAITLNSFNNKTLATNTFTQSHI